MTNLLQSRTIGVGFTPVTSDLVCELDAVLHERTDGVAAGPDELSDIEGFRRDVHPARFDLGEVQKVVDHCEEMVAGLRHLL